MRFKELLLELNIPKLVNDFGAKLAEKYIHEFNKKITGEEVIKIIADKDPTPNKELTFWLCLNYAKGLINRWEDIGSRAIPALLKYKALLRKPNLDPKLQIRDINQIKGLSALEDLIEQYKEKDTSSNSESASKEEQNFFKTGQAVLVYNDDQVKVVIPKTKEASCFFGINTRWCTAAKKNNAFDEYNKQGSLYIVLLKKENARYQFHYQTSRFMNEKDERINPNELADKYPILWKIFNTIAEQNKSLMLNQNPSERVQLAAVNRNGNAIQYIKNPSEEVQLEAVREYGQAIQYIKNPSEAVQLAAVKKYGYTIQYIKNPSEEVQLAAVRQNGYVIKFIDNPSEEVQLEAVKKYFAAFKNITNPSEAVQHYYHTKRQELDRISEYLKQIS